MPLPRGLARFNRHATNLLGRRVARWLPGSAIVVHRGRRSGALYRTPVAVFGRPGGYVVALTYGPRADWVQNVLAAGACDLEIRGRRVHVAQPRVVRDRRRQAVPIVVRPILGLIGAAEFLELTTACA